MRECVSPDLSIRDTESTVDTYQRADGNAVRNSIPGADRRSDRGANIDTAPDTIAGADGSAK